MAEASVGRDLNVSIAVVVGVVVVVEGVVEEADPLVASVVVLQLVEEVVQTFVVRESYVSPEWLP